ncbi:DUF642 domain-containing protein [Embleya sp. NPDC059237]|uniref:DUF642 domain-containing protein n=1 Tax=Embleya sp. NPDC059237 TaxID=3346784 RepID=UPI0036CC6427
MMKYVPSGALLGATLLVVVASSAPAAGAGIENGTFQIPGVNADSYRRIGPADSLQPTPWRVTDGNVDLYGTEAANNPHQAVDLNGGQPGAIAQVFSPTIGKKVTITWKEARNTTRLCGTNATVVQKYSVTVLGKTTVTSDPSGLQPGVWRTSPQELTFVASDHLHTLTFVSQTPNDCGPMITDVVADEG